MNVSGSAQFRFRSLGANEMTGFVKFKNGLHEMAVTGRIAVGEMVEPGGREYPVVEDAGCQGRFIEVLQEYIGLLSVKYSGRLH